MANIDREALIKEASQLTDDFKFLQHIYKDDAERRAFLENFDAFDQACLYSSTSWYQFMTKHKARLQAPPTKEMLVELSGIVNRADKLMILSKDLKARLNNYKNDATGREHKALMSLLEIISENQESLNFVLSMKVQLDQRRKKPTPQ